MPAKKNSHAKTPSTAKVAKKGQAFCALRAPKNYPLIKKAPQKAKLSFVHSLLSFFTPACAERSRSAAFFFSHQCTNNRPPDFVVRAGLWRWTFLFFLGVLCGTPLLCVKKSGQRPPQATLFVPFVTYVVKKKAGNAR
ncbi:MAG: hypothetical protein ABR572_11380 [Cryomorphaceae bacterium]